eukprot:gnl/Dysnectes_brevis/3424_a4319_772.p1 GENE.gnl/Dysnectes_brevis/3424_a4319_772~~gnl/Dysnectes_brevis/3424_a4319_772.p1  ORF type:complete len:1234 (+),score=145.83 gnl/Dysnectes_brevis/3424_a4319_772:484-3702(+)
MKEHCSIRHSICPGCSTRVSEDDPNHHLRVCPLCPQELYGCMLADHVAAHPDHIAPVLNILEDQRLQQELHTETQKQVARRDRERGHPLTVCFDAGSATHGPFVVLEDQGRSVGKVESSLEEIAFFAYSPASKVHRWVVGAHTASCHRSVRVGVLADSSPVSLIDKLIPLSFSHPVSSTVPVSITLDLETRVISFQLHSSDESRSPSPPLFHPLLDGVRYRPAAVLCSPGDHASILEYSELEEEEACQAKAVHREWLISSRPQLCSTFSVLGTHADDVSLTSEGRIATSTKQGMYLLVPGNLALQCGVHRWSFRIISIGIDMTKKDDGPIASTLSEHVSLPTLSVGAMALDSIQPEMLLGTFEHSMSLDNLGNCTENSKQVDLGDDGWLIHSGDRLDVELDMIERNIRFISNTDEDRVICRPLPTSRPCSIAFALRSAGASVKLLSYEGQYEEGPSVGDHSLSEGDDAIAVVPPSNAPRESPVPIVASSHFLTHRGSVVGKSRLPDEEEAILFGSTTVAVDSYQQDIYDIELLSDNCRVAFFPESDSKMISPSFDVPSVLLPKGHVQVGIDAKNQEATLHCLPADVTLTFPLTVTDGHSTSVVGVILSATASVVRIGPIRSGELEKGTNTIACTSLQGPMKLVLQSDPQSEPVHVLQCLFCSQNVCAEGWADHAASCPDRLAYCLPCQWRGTAEDLKRHLRSCDYSMRTCSGCGREMLLHVLRSHMALQNCSPYGLDMVLEFEVDSSCKTLTIPVNGGLFDALIFWGDGDHSSVRSSSSTGLQHTYLEAATYTVRIRGLFQTICISKNPESLTQLRRILQLGSTGLTNLSEAFANCTNLTAVLGLCDLSTVTDMQKMFQSCTSLTGIDISHWNCGKTTDMSYMFSSSGLQTVNASHLDTSSVTTFAYMFQNCSQLVDLDVSGWNTSSATSLESTFSGCSVLEYLDTSLWDVSNVTTLSEVCLNCKQLRTIEVGDWDIIMVESMHRSFYCCNSLQTLDVSRWNTQRVNTMHHMFQSCSSLTVLDVEHWNTSKVTDMCNMFEKCSSIGVLKVSRWNKSQSNSQSWTNGCSAALQ